MKAVFDFTERQSVAIEKLTDNQTRFALFGGAAGGGKSWIIVSWLIGMCFAYPRTRWFIGREELKRLRESTLITFFKAIQYYKIPQTEFNYNGQDHFIKFTNGSQIDLLDLKYLPSDPLYERYGSVEYTGGAIEEGGEVHFGAFDVLKTRIGRYNNEKYNLLPSKLLITANPKKNWLYKVFYLPYSTGTLSSEYSFIPALASENPYLEAGYLLNLDGITDLITKERLKYGNWEYDDTKDQLIPYDRIQDIFTNAHVTPGKKYITADVARFGKDKTVIGLWSGFRLEKITVIDKSRITEVSRVIRELARINSIPTSQVIVDEEGVGGGVVDDLRCIGFVSGSRPIEVKGKQCNYTNLKAQVCYMFADKVNEAGVYVPGVSTEREKELIIEEVEQIRSSGVDDDRRLGIISKDKVKETIGRSPDYADMLIMRMYFELPFNTKITHWSIN